MRFIRLCLIALLAMPFLSFAATETQGSAAECESADDTTEFRVANTEIDAWAQGTVSKIGDGALVVHGTNMPLATVHAQMRHEMQQKLAGIDDPQQRAQIMKQVKDAWRSKLEAAFKEPRGPEQDFTFNKPEDSASLVILDGKDFRELPFFQRIQTAREQRQKAGLDERDLVTLYNAREARMAARSEQPISVKFDQEKREAAAEKLSEKGKARAEAAREKLASERLSLSDLKPGDRVFVGYNHDTAFAIIRHAAPAVAPSTAAPAAPSAAPPTSAAPPSTEPSSTTTEPMSRREERQSEREMRRESR